jgi:hypothetical protein
MRTFHVALLFFILACLSPAYAQAAGEIVIRNESQDFTLITVAFIAKGERAEIDVMIDPGESKSVPISGDGPVDVDCDMGMNDVRYLFTGVALEGADTLVVRDAEKPGQEEIRPTLVMLAGGKEMKSIAGTMTQEDLSGYTDEEKAQLEEMVAAFTARKTAQDVIAVLYTRTKHQGLFWEITDAGKYDLEQDFRLPNDSILSLHILPGYEITLWQDSGFKGESKTWGDNDPELQGKWRRQASSLVIERQNGEVDPVARDVIDDWLAEVAEAQNNEPDESALYADTENIASVLDKYAASFEFFTQRGEADWHGEPTEEGRADMAGDLLQLLSDLGHDVAEWTPNTFARQINNYLSKGSGCTIWQTACLIVGARAQWYVELYAGKAEEN